MPEGPSILHLKDQLQPFKNKIVKNAGGSGEMPTAWIKGKKLLDIETWGKHLLLIFTNGAVRIHLGLFGDVLINERKKVNRSFFLEFTKGEINGYIVRAKKLTEPIEEIYDWRTDILSGQFDKAHVKKLVRDEGEKPIDDILMDQNIFTGVGNKIRNEALYRAGIHPLSLANKIPSAKLTKLVNEVVKYAKIFYKNLSTDGTNKDFDVYKKDFAPDGSEVTMQVLKKTKRKIYFSEHKQKLYE
ncbi:MAG: DNA-formamidopyrimidine glycosylase family protein [Chitinophagaceae bacterium]